MSEPTNPLFEEEKAFLERKKLEYERALRGDVAQLKEQTANAGRIALVGAGLTGSIWLITKTLGGRKRSKKRERDEHYDHYEQDAPRYDHDDDSFDYHNQYFGDADFADEEDEHEYAEDHWQDQAAAYDADDYFASDDHFSASEHLEPGHGDVYHADSDAFDSPAAYTEPSQTDDTASSHPAFAAPTSHHSEPGDDDADKHFASEAYGHPDSTLAFDDSRRLPESNDFPEHNALANDFDDSKPGYDFSHLVRPATAKHPAQAGNTLGSMLLSLAKGSVGKAVLSQAAGIGIALAAKALKERIPALAPETAKNSDLATVSWENDGYAHGHPATSQPDVTSAPADATFRFPDPA